MKSSLIWSLNQYSEWFRGFQTYLWSIFLSTFHWNLWLEQSSQIWKNLFLLNLRNSTIPKVFLSEIVNFPSFHIQTFHISCGSPPQLPPVHYLTLYSHLTTLPKWSSKWNISNAKIFFFFGRQFYSVSISQIVCFILFSFIYWVISNSHWRSLQSQ